MCKFAAMETLFDQDEDEKVVHPRDKVRESIFLGAVIQLDGAAEPCNVRVRNISSGGMMIDLAGPQPKGLVVNAEMKGIGKVNGRIAWSTENRTGIVFDSAVDPRLARQTVGQAPAAPAYTQPVLVGTRRPGLAIR